LLMLVVIDTNILVSALWSRDGAPAKVISLILNEALIPCYDHRIMSEYREVLERPKFGFLKTSINSLLEWFESIGRSIVAEPCDGSFIHEADKKFYEVAKFCHAKLITGNLKHFPDDPDILSVVEFLDQYEKKME
jgi:uncharacterized protein